MPEYLHVLSDGRQMKMEAAAFLLRSREEEVKLNGKIHDDHRPHWLLQQAILTEEWLRAHKERKQGWKRDGLKGFKSPRAKL
jgi:hypothetical protein